DIHTTIITNPPHASSWILQGLITLRIHRVKNIFSNNYFYVEIDVQTDRSNLVRTVRSPSANLSLILHYFSWCSTILHTPLTTSLFLGLNQLDYTLNVFMELLKTMTLVIMHIKILSLCFSFFDGNQHAYLKEPVRELGEKL
ncbi:hypothetical protein ACJX0J_033054, partial [Zea mays]